MFFSHIIFVGIFLKIFGRKDFFVVKIVVVLTDPESLRGVLQHPDDVFALDAGAREALRPLDEEALPQARLAAGEREGEAEGKMAAREAVLHRELVDTRDDVVEELQHGVRRGEEGG